MSSGWNSQIWWTVATVWRWHGGAIITALFCISCYVLSDRRQVVDVAPDLDTQTDRQTSRCTTSPITDVRRRRCWRGSRAGRSASDDRRGTATVCVSRCWTRRRFLWRRWGRRLTTQTRMTRRCVVLSLTPTSDDAPTSTGRPSGMS